MIKQFTNFIIVITEKSAAVTETPAAADINDANTEDVDAAGGNDEFISDAYNLEISDEDLMKEMEALRASPAGDEGELVLKLQGSMVIYMQ